MNRFSNLAKPWAERPGLSALSPARVPALGFAFPFLAVCCAKPRATVARPFFLSTAYGLAWGFTLFLAGSLATLTLSYSGSWSFGQ